MSKCPGCGTEEDQKAQMKRLEEMMKKRVKPTNCPYKATCNQKMLKDEAEVMCKDQEKSQEAVMVHMQGRHIWEMCKVFRETEQERKGKLPRDW